MGMVFIFVSLAFLIPKGEIPPFLLTEGEKCATIVITCERNLKKTV